MTACLLDSGFLYALIDENDANHSAVVESMTGLRGEILFPIPAVTETSYFVLRNLGAEKNARFILDLASTPQFTLESPNGEDLIRAAELLRKYNDANIDFVDVLIVAMSEHLDITKILTIDRRHFQMFRPAHCEAYKILP